MIINFPMRDEIPKDVQLGRRDAYYYTYVWPIYQMLQLLPDVDMQPWGGIQQEVLPDGCHYRMRWTLDGQSYLVGVDFTDGRDMWLDPEKTRDLLVLFKFKHCERGRPTYDAAHCPVVPGGYITAPATAGDDSVANAFLNGLPLSRFIRDSQEPVEGLYVRHVFNASAVCPARRRFHGQIPESIRQLGSEGKKVRFDVHMREAARARCVLNLSGPEETIDRKLVEYAAVGSAIISDRCVHDLNLPYGFRFVHKENIYFVDEPSELEEAVEWCSKTANWEQLVRGSRELYDVALSRASMAEWYKDLVTASACSGRVGTWPKKTH